MWSGPLCRHLLRISGLEESPEGAEVLWPVGISLFWCGGHLPAGCIYRSADEKIKAFRLGREGRSQLTAVSVSTLGALHSAHTMHVHVCVCTWSLCLLWCLYPLPCKLMCGKNINEQEVTDTQTDATSSHHKIKVSPQSCRQITFSEKLGPVSSQICYSFN